MLKPITNYGFPHSLTAQPKTALPTGGDNNDRLGANVGIIFIIRVHDMLIMWRARDRSLSFPCTFPRSSSLTN